MMSLWDALRMNMMISYQELVRTFLNASAEAKSEDIESEIKAICRDHKIETKKIIALLTKIADERVVNEIMLLIDGAIIHAQMGMETDEVITSLKRALADLIGG
ncbi:hypothetical protein [Enterobacter roggenkampii]|uniref:hypothetical protein n=1 Tax=Enterobacter roggenkampii TaxID=1812935 RepID=UPI003C6C5D8E